MTGTIINGTAVLLGATLGSIFGEKRPPRIRETVMHGVGLVVLVVGLDMALDSKNLLIVLGSVLLGGILGEMLRLHSRLEHLGKWLENSAKRIPFLTRGEFTKGFVMASLVFCTGPMAILGSIQDGLHSDFTLLSIKSVLDGFSSLAFAAAMGMGVAFSAITILALQGSITLGATLFDRFLSEAMISELSATGGVLMLGIGLLLLEIKAVRVVNFTPALAFAPLLVAVWQVLGLH